MRATSFHLNFCGKSAPSNQKEGCQYFTKNLYGDYVCDRNQSKCVEAGLVHMCLCVFFFFSSLSLFITYTPSTPRSYPHSPPPRSSSQSQRDNARRSAPRAPEDSPPSSRSGVRQIMTVPTTTSVAATPAWNIPSANLHTKRWGPLCSFNL